jgi:hypothetical protein
MIDTGLALFVIATFALGYWIGVMAERGRGK